MRALGENDQNGGGRTTGWDGGDGTVKSQPKCVKKKMPTIICEVL